MGWRVAAGPKRDVADSKEDEFAARRVNAFPGPEFADLAREGADSGGLLLRHAMQRAKPQHQVAAGNPNYIAIRE